MSKTLTPARLTADLVANVLVPVVDGKPPLEVPISGAKLTQAQREKLRLSARGSTLVFDVGESSVVLDLSEATAMISFVGGDADQALGMVEAALQRKFGSLRQIEDSSHPRGGKKRLRVYEGDLSGRRHCKVEVDYPDKDAKKLDLKFVVRVTAFEHRTAS